MFTAALRREVRVEGLVSTSRKRENDGERTRAIPTVIQGAQVPLYLTGTNYEKPDPCTLNVVVEEFYNREGKRKEFPFVLQPQEEVVGYTGLTYKDPLVRTYEMPLDSILCVETRSRQAARRGFTCVGFYERGEIRPFLDEPGKINLLFRNDLPVPVEIAKPFSPAQLWIIGYMLPQSKKINNKIIIKDGEEDVTEKNRIAWIEELKLYTVHLGEGIKYFLPQREPVPLEELEKVVKEGRLENINPTVLDFSLTITRETIVTNGCPVYLFPFHYRDISFAMLRDRECLEVLYKETFVERRYMSITTNAGLHNPGSSAGIIFENCAKGRKFTNPITGERITREIFQEGAPFGVVMPLPFYDGSTSTTYKKDNRGIEL